MANELERPAGLSLWAQISIALAIAVTGSVISMGFEVQWYENVR
jgi:hypothetical protein